MVAGLYKTKGGLTSCDRLDKLTMSTGLNVF